MELETVLIDTYDLETRCGSRSFGEAFNLWLENVAQRRGYLTEHVHGSFGHDTELTNRLWDEFCGMSESTHRRYGYRSRDAA